jgi:hypothetical protein
MTAGGNGAATMETAAVAAWALVHGLSMLLIDGALDVPHNVDDPEMLAARVVTWLVAGLEAAAKPLEASSTAKRGAPLRKPRKRK